MLSKFRPKSNFSRNVLTLMTGTTVAQAIPMAISPILTRIYTPKDFGVFALFFAISAIFGSIANGKYELAIMNVKDDEEAINIFVLGMTIVLSFSIVLFVLIVIWHSRILNLLHNQDISIWLYFVPLSVFFMGFFNMLTYYNIKKKNYKSISKATIMKSIILSVIQLFFGFIIKGVFGLITGELFSRIFSNMQLLKNVYNDANKKLISKDKMYYLAKKYSHYPKFTLWATLFNALSNHIVNIFLSIIYSVKTLGFYSLAEKVLGAPLGLMGKSIGQVFFQQASEEFKTDGTIIKTFIYTIKKLFFLSLPIFIVVFFIVKPVFVFVFGGQWRVAGEIAQILTFLYFARFIVAPVTTIPMIINRVKIDFWFQTIMLLVISIVVAVSYVYKVKILIFAYVISFVYGGYYFVYLLILFNIIRVERIKVVT